MKIPRNIAYDRSGMLSMGGSQVVLVQLVFIYVSL